MAPTYGFGEFELNSDERSLTKAGACVLLQPKTLDALLYLVSKAQKLVSKKELIESLWPDIYVGDTNLTNIVVSLRKLLGKAAIQTVSKHGYRFVLPVQGGIHLEKRDLHERLARARDLISQRSLESFDSARTLLWICLAEAPDFAPAWAWLGRCCWQVVKFRGAPHSDQELASAAFQRAFALDPDLAIAHQFFTPFEVDTGRARAAMARLRQRLMRRPDEPEALTGLVQVLRCCGLLEESIEMSRRASKADPAVITSAPHTYFLLCDHRATIETYGGRSSYYLDAAAWTALGEVKRARDLLRQRLEKTTASGFIAVLMRSLYAILTGQTAEAAKLMRDAHPLSEPEGLIYFARHYAQIGMLDDALNLIKQATSEGFLLSPVTLSRDPAFAAVRKHKGYAVLLRSAQARVEEARAEWLSYTNRNPAVAV